MQRRSESCCRPPSTSSPQSTRFMAGGSMGAAGGLMSLETRWLLGSRRCCPRAFSRAGMAAPHAASLASHTARCTAIGPSLPDVACQWIHPTSALVYAGEARQPAQWRGARLWRLAAGHNCAALGQRIWRDRSCSRRVLPQHRRVWGRQPEQADGARGSRARPKDGRAALCAAPAS